MSVKISELPILDSLADNDVIAGVDTSANVTSKIEMATLKNYIDTNTQYTAGTNIDITNNVVSAPFVYDRTQTNALLENIRDDVNTQIEELQSEVGYLSTIFNAFPTESGEGESVTLDDTAEVKFKKFDLKGNTSQTTYSGKNLFDKSNYVDNYYISSTGELVAENGNFVSYYIPVSSGNYIISGANAEKIIRCAIYDSNQTFIRRELTTVATSLAITISNDEKYVRVSGYKVDSNTFQLEKGSTATSYEPYVGGTASPNPSYPQPINVVSGDNEINVVGKNLIKLKNGSNVSQGVTITINDNKATFVGTPTRAYVGSVDMPLNLKKGTYTFSSTNGVNSFFLWFKNQGGNVFSSVAIRPNPSTITLNEDVYSIQVGLEGLTVGTACNVETYFQLEKGSSATSYEPYQGDAYNIDLPVENLLQCNLVSTTTGGVTITNNDDESFTLQGTSTTGIGRDIHGEITLKAGTYTFSADHLPAGVYISLANVSNTILNKATPSRTFTISTDTTYAKCLLWIDSGYTVNDTIKIQLEKGSKQNNFTPYGTTPIELCKIGNYQDYFGKSDGRNLFDNTYNDLGMWITNIGETTTFAQGSQYLGAYCKVEPGTYTISRNKKTNRFRIGVSPNQPTGGSSSCYVVASNDNANSITIDVPQGNNYICIYLSNTSETSTNVDLMIEKGSSASDYQPYGVGKWYLHKEIGKIVLNGSEAWTKSSNTNVNRYYIPGTFINTILNVNTIDLISDYFTCITPTQSDAYNVGLSKLNNTSIMVNFSLSDTSFDTLQKFTTWLSSHNVVVYYVLATPVNTALEDMQSIFM